MLRNFTLSTLLTICLFVVGQFANAAIINDNGTSTTYNLGANDSLTIVSGTYTGTISGFPTGARITVTSAAAFQPASMPNNAAGTMYIYGIFSYNTASLTTNSNFTINNYGIVSLRDVTMKGSGELWTNNFGAVMNFSGDVTVNSNPAEANTIINYGTMNFSTNLTMTTNATIINYKLFNVGGEFKVNGGKLENRGKLNTTGLLNFNNGAAEIRNYCGMSSSGGIRNTSNNFFNYSYLWARNDLGMGDITNSGTIYMLNWGAVNSSAPIIHGKSYTQSGSGILTGQGWLYFYGTTTQLGGVTGTAGVTTDTLRMKDISRSNFTTFYDPVQAGTVYPNAIYYDWGAPDSLRAYLIGCSLEISLEIILPIKWNYFFVNLVNDIPLLTWSAEFDQSTIFEIQRSYDGTNFYGIKEIASELGISEYVFSDKLVNTQSPVVYYRIKATQLSGEEKYTQVRTVRFNSKKENNLVTAPNPFNNNFIINYQSAEKEMITIRMFNVSGQQQLAKQVPVNDGVNIITITEAAQLPTGIYIIQVSNGNKMISSGKLIKQ